MATASVRSIVVGEHSVVNMYSYHPSSFPAGAKSVEMKYCENCMCMFYREICKCKLSALLEGKKIDYFNFECQCEKYCATCVGRMLLPYDLSSYEEQLPRAQEQRQSHHLPKYDNSLLPVEQQRVYTAPPLIPPQRRPWMRYAMWRDKLLQLFREKGKLTALEIQEIVGNHGGPSDAVNLVRANKSFPRLIVVGYAERNHPMGRPPRLYSVALEVQ